MPSGEQFGLISGPTNPTAGGYAPPATALFGTALLSPAGDSNAATTAQPYMNAFGNMHAPPGINDPYGVHAAAGTAFLGTTAGSYVTFAPAAMLPSTGSPTSASSGGGPPVDDVRTVFITGFPADVRERELHNLLRFMPGYEACQMSYKAGGPQGFALFSTALHARAVVELLSGLQYDDSTALRAEVAHKNMFIKPEDPSIKRASLGSPALLAASNVLSLPLGTASSGGLIAAQQQHQQQQQQHQQQQVVSVAPAAPAFLAAAAAAAAAAANSSPLHAMLAPPALPLRPPAFSPVTNLRDNSPCNTLFIGNLGNSVMEQELRALFSGQPGYRQLKIVRGPKATTAFVEFVDVATAAAVHTALQGAQLPSNERGGMRVQFSKNPFGRRDAIGSGSGGVATSPSPATGSGLSSGGSGFGSGDSPGVGGGDAMLHHDLMGGGALRMTTSSPAMGGPAAMPQGHGSLLSLQTGPSFAASAAASNQAACSDMMASLSSAGLIGHAGLNTLLRNDL